ncbi:IclR family transcriptional regulator [Paenibacillus filicis]|uniref:IclR family transcriptional regulator n=1 Tax=Paenibacillus filicis TaxID=669464 RepID=A0ABU9DQY0_9BACL
MNGTQALGRALDILFVLAEAGTTLTVSEIAERVAIPESSAYRFIQTLEQHGIVERKGKGRITLGLRIFDLARSLSGQIDRQLLIMARPVMEELTRRTDETSVLFIRSGLDAICIEHVKSRKLISVSLENGRVLPLDSGASGKVLLAYESEVLIGQAVAQKSPDRAKALRQELERIRHQGYSYTNGEFDPDAFAVGAPILDKQQRIVASLSVAGPNYRFHESHLPALAEETRTAAADISRQLGWPGI